jgi:hypothetical protein
METVGMEYLPSLTSERNVRFLLFPAIRRPKAAARWMNLLQPASLLPRAIQVKVRGVTAW